MGAMEIEKHDLKGQGELKAGLYRPASANWAFSFRIRTA